MSANKEIFKKFESLKSASFIGINGYTNSFGEVANITLNTNVSTESAKQKDFDTLKSLNESDLKTIAENCGQNLDLVKQALSELLTSAEKNLNEDINERSNQSIAQIDAYVNLGNGLKLHKDTLEVSICGFQNQKKVIIEGVYKKVNKQAKTICKDAIKKHCDLRMEKYRTYKLGKIETLKITGDTIQIL